MRIDSHCHVDLYPDPHAVLANLEKDRVLTISMTNLPSHFEMGLPHLKGCRWVRPALGLHPSEVSKHSKSTLANELRRFERSLPLTSWIGEVGLDGRREYRESRHEQTLAFGQIVAQIRALGDAKVMSIHSAGAVREVLDAIRAVGEVIPILHRFTGSHDELQAAVSTGCWFSVNPAMMRSSAGRARIEAMPRSRILTESDGPFVRIGDRAVVPADTDLVLEQLARMWGQDPSEVAAKVRANFNEMAQGLRHEVR